MTFKMRSSMVCVGMVGFTAIASAAPISGSLSLGIGGVSSSPSSNLSLNDTFTFATFPIIGANSYVSGTTGDFNAVPAFSGVNQSVLSIPSLTSYNWASSFGSFQASVLTIGATTYTPYATIGTNAAGQTTLTAYEYGKFTPGGVLSGYSTTNMAETISLTQTVTNGSISFSASAATLAPVPEPSAVAAMGIGLIGLLGLRRRQR